MTHADLKNCNEPELRALVIVCEEALQAAKRYDESIAGKLARDQIKLTDAGAFIESTDLDKLYTDWQDKTRIALHAIAEKKGC